MISQQKSYHKQEEMACQMMKRQKFLQNLLYPAKIPQVLHLIRLLQAMNWHPQVSQYKKNMEQNFKNILIK